MQKKIISVIFILFVSVHIFAQYGNYDTSSINMDQLRFGIKLTPRIAWLDIKHNDAQADGATLKYGVGITAEYELNSIMSVISGVNYSTLGGYAYDSLSLNTSTTKDNYKINYTQIEIPLGLKFQTPYVNKTSYYIQGGFMSGFIIAAKEKYKSTVAHTTIPDEDILSLTHTSNVGYFAGIGTQYKITDRINLFAEISYKNSMTNVANGDAYVTNGTHDYNYPIEIYPASMDFSFGVKF